MTTLLLFILIVWLVYYLAKTFFPRIVMWGLNRHIRRKYGQAYDQFNNQYGRQQQQRQRTSPFSRSSKKKKPQRRSGKIIPNDVGEYVEFEDIPTYNDGKSTIDNVEARDTKKYKDEPQVSDADWEEIK